MLRYPPLSAENYIRNRAAFAEALSPGAMALFSSNDVYPTSADGTLPFRQDSNMLHLTGVDQEETVLLLFPDAHNPADREILFVTETNEEIAIWEGAKLTKAEATAQTGVKQVQWLSMLERTIQRLVTECSCCYLHQNEHTRAKIVVETREARFNQWFCETYPHVRIERAAPILHRTRSVERGDRADAPRLRHHPRGFNRVMNTSSPASPNTRSRPSTCTSSSARAPAGSPTRPSWPAGQCLRAPLHREQRGLPGRRCALMDVGPFGNYASDMTRCLRVSGRFTDRQRKVYDAVLSVMRDATKLLRPGVSLHDYHKQVGELMTEQLLGLGLIDKHDIAKQNAWPAYKKYFMHGTSHFIGLDVHDVGLWHEPIRAGHVFTVEPGIYILEEGLGIRLENDIVVTEDGFDDLMGDIPLDAEAIEDAMNS